MKIQLYKKKFFTVYARSILEQIPNLDLVKQCVLDYLHVVLLGVMKKLLKIWFGKKSYYSKQVKGNVSKVLVNFDKSLPPEFQRHSRTLENLNSFHGNELRTILLFSGVVAFAENLIHEHYVHFLYLHCAIRILVSPFLCISHNSVARSILRKFVIDFGDIYGEDQVSFNVHSLTHLADDVISLGF